MTRKINSINNRKYIKIIKKNSIEDFIELNLLELILEIKRKYSKFEIINAKTFIKEIKNVKC